MKIISAVSINLKKLKYRRSKAVLIIIPVSFLVLLSIVVTSQVKNIQQAVDDNIISELEDTYTLIDLEYQAEESTFARGNFQAIQSGFNENDLAKVQLIEGVENASITYQVPIDAAKTSDLFDSITLSLNNISALAQELAGIYTSEDFSYVEGEPVPIILNARAFRESYQDWGDQQEISFSMEDIRPERNQDMSEKPSEPKQLSPIKTRAIDYEKDDLMGKEFTIDFGGLAEIASFEVSMEEGVTTYTKLTDEEKAELESARKDVISTYWDYEAIKEPISVKFVVVGVIEDESDANSYVPDTFASSIIEEQIQKQLQARTDVAIDADTLESNFTGLYYNGTNLTTNLSGPGFGRMMERPGMGGGFAFGGSQLDSDQETYQIPGLAISISETDSSVEGIYEASDAFANSAKSGEHIMIKIQDLLERSTIVEALNEKGYAYQDINNLDVLMKLQNTLDQISIVVIVSFIVLSTFVIFFSMSRVVGESVKEIGIFRAVGFTRNDILKIYMLQAFIYVSFGYLAGVILGVLLNLAISPVVSKWFSSFVDGTLKQTLNVVSEIDTNVFIKIDLNSILILSMILVVITILVSIIPSFRASNVSPIEAIKSE